MWEEITMNYVLEKLREKGRHLVSENSMNYVLDKVKEWLVVVVNFGGSLIGKVDEVFPPKTRGGRALKMMKAPAEGVNGCLGMSLKATPNRISVVSVGILFDEPH